VDLHPQPDNPHSFEQGNAIEVLAGLIDTGEIQQYSAIHASPPCQRFSTPGRTRWKHRREQWPDMIAATRALLRETGLLYVIENVPGAPLLNYTMLCGTMFGLRVIRHRHFETNWVLTPPHHRQHEPRVEDENRKRGGHSAYFQVAGNGGESPGFKLEEWQAAMGIDWLPKVTLVQAIPPAYTEYIGVRLMRKLLGQPPLEGFF